MKESTPIKNNYKYFLALALAAAIVVTIIIGGSGIMNNAQDSNSTPTAHPTPTPGQVQTPSATATPTPVATPSETAVPTTTPVVTPAPTLQTPASPTPVYGWPLYNMQYGPAVPTATPTPTPAPTTGTISGHIMYNDDPLPGIFVYIANEDDRTPIGSYSATTDDDGYYEITGVPFGTYFIAISESEESANVDGSEGLEWAALDEDNLTATVDGRLGK